MSNVATTVGALRKMLADTPLPDDTPLSPTWFDGPPADKDPAVTVHGLAVVGGELQVLVGIQYLDEFNDPEDEADDDDDSAE